MSKRLIIYSEMEVGYSEIEVARKQATLIAAEL